MTTGRWVLVGLASSVLLMSLVLAFQGHLGSWFTSVGMVCILLSVWMRIRQTRRNQDSQINK